jgi:hypothetical protein
MKKNERLTSKERLEWLRVNKEIDGWYEAGYDQAVFELYMAGYTDAVEFLASEERAEDA